MNTTQITINLDDILNRIYAESAWHTAYRKGAYTLTPDNAAMLEMRIADGLSDLRSRMAGYVKFWNYNPNIPDGNITIELKFEKPVPDGTGDTLKGAITELLAFYALMCFYGEKDTNYGTGWRLHRTKVKLVLSLDTL